MKGPKSVFSVGFLALLMLLYQYSLFYPSLSTVTLGISNGSQSQVSNKILTVVLNLYGLDSTEGKAAVFLTISNSSYGSVVDLSRMDSTDGLDLRGVSRTSLDFTGVNVKSPETFRICIFIPMNEKLGCYEDRILDANQVVIAYILFR